MNKHFAWILLAITTTCLCLPKKLANFANLKDETDVYHVTATYDEKTKTFGIQEAENVSKVFVAQTSFKNSMNETGWSLLQVVTNGSYTDLLQAEAAGLVEGYISAQLISYNYINTVKGYCDNEKEFCVKLFKFMDSNSVWVKKQVQTQPQNPYWHQVSLIYKQLDGMYEGYKRSKVKPDISLREFRLIQLGGDLEDLEQALGKKSYKKVVGSGSCSALVKLFPKNTDLAISHVTWNDYVGMLRIYKLYNFTYHMNDQSEDLVSGGIVSFSSSPGSIYSGDDYYILNSGLVSQETTIGNSNADLWKYVTPQSLMEWARTLIANRLAKTGNEWCSLFERHNSGTYNNQWMVLDYNRFTPGHPLLPDTLWVAEQIPGMVQMGDMTMLLQKHGYWASYNLPYFPEIYDMSGVTDAKNKYGDWFDYHQSPRAQIFKREIEKVVDMQSLVKLMRYNDFKHDPVAKCNCTPPYSGENAISSRSDLNPKNGTYPFGALGHRRHGGTDCKATNSQMAKSLSQFIVAGPTFNQQPAFQWSKTEWKKPAGHPDVFKFEPKLLDWQNEEWIVSPEDL